jgi:hypothetical protein
MKKYLLLFLGFLPFVCLSQAETQYERIPAADINPQRLAFVSNLADRILTAQQGGGYYMLTAQEADVAMRTGLTEAVQKQAYAQLKRSFGEYQGLIFDELLLPTEGTAFEIYRFRGQFGANGSGVEIRAVLNPEGKLAGFYYKPWQNRL